MPLVPGVFISCSRRLGVEVEGVGAVRTIRVGPESEEEDIFLEFGCAALKFSLAGWGLRRSICRQTMNLMNHFLASDVFLMFQRFVHGSDSHSSLLHFNYPETS